MGEFGELLRHARAYRGVSLVDAERATRINRRYLAALEQEAFDQLPPLTYARGIVRIYAQYLGLDPVTVLAKFEEVHGQRSMAFRIVPTGRPLQEPLMHWAPNFAVIAFMLAISAIVFALVYTTYLAPRQQPTPTLLASTENTTPVPTAAPSLNVDAPAAIHSPGATHSLSPAASTMLSVSSASTPESSAPQQTPNPSAEPTPPASPGSPRSEHLFEIVTTGRVWVQATVDGRTVLAEVLEAGARRTYRGQTMTVSSGNAPLVRVIVDGEDRGPLGQRWDQTATYP